MLDKILDWLIVCIEWVNSNKEWLFPGSGLAICALLFRIFFRRSQTASDQNIQSGEKSVNVQAGRDIVLKANANERTVEKSTRSIISVDQSKNLVVQIIENNASVEYIDQKIKEEVDKLRKSRSFPEFDRTDEVIDQKIKEEVDKLRKSRFFLELDHTETSLRLGRRLVDGDLSIGSDGARAHGLNWSARLLSRSEELECAEEFVEVAKSLGNFPETKIAESFILSQKGDKSAALQVLAGINSNISRSAGLMIVNHHDGAAGALYWMEDSGYTAKDLDSDGKLLLIDRQFQLQRWDNALEIASSLSETDFEETPALYFLTALSNLVMAVPTEFRKVVLVQVPFQAAGFRLASDPVAMDARRVAHGFFLKAKEVAERLNCPLVARQSDEYALWLELRDPAQNIQGKSRLKEKLRDQEISLGFVHYAIEFGIKLDFDAVEQDIEKNIAKNGGITLDSALARFALAFTKSTPEEIANYIARHYNQLVGYIDSKILLYRQIELFSRAGLIQRAQEILDELLEGDIPDVNEEVLRRIISEAQGDDPVESRKAQYEATGALNDLINLVVELEINQQWEEVCEFGRRLFEETHSFEDAERLTNAFHKTQKSKELVEFINENPEFLSQSRHIQMLYAWGLYNEGALLQSRAALENLSDDVEDPNYRSLQLNLGIAMGDWASLSAYITNEYQNRHDRSAQELMITAQLSIYLGLPYAKDFVFEAVSKAEDEASLLAAANFIATSAGWEDDPIFSQWLARAVELSDDDGPLQRVSLREIFDSKSKWDDQESRILQMLGQAETPIFLAARSLNRTLIDFTIFSALVNLSETDPRRRTTIPAYSGKHAPLEYDIHRRKVGLDATALLTLSFLNILDESLDAFDAVYIPHSTLSWLFEEWQKATFHQPSRIKDAHKIRNLLSTNVLEKFTPSTVADSDLSAKVGDELAELIAEAERFREGDDTQHVVVCSAPVHHISSLMEEEVDLSAHSSVLSSCLNVVKKLKQKAQITAEEERTACTFFQLHEKPWPNERDISDGATLYLDDLAIKNLLHVGLLEKLKDAGLSVVASPREVSEVDALIAYEQISDDVKDVIERIRTTLNSRIESGQVKVSRRGKFDEAKKKSILGHPTTDIITLSSQCDVVIVDDRFINQKETIGHGDSLAPILCTSDLIDSLVTANVISDDSRLEFRTKLRRSGFIFVPVCEKELELCIRTSDVVDGNVVETAELKAIRESILRVRMSDWLQLPDEAPWLIATLKAFIRVLKNLWEDDANIDEVKVRSNWLVDKIDVRGWAHSFDPEHADNTVHTLRGLFIQSLLMPPDGVEQQILEEYWKWVDEEILAPIKEQFPDLYAWIVEQYKQQVDNLATTEFTEKEEA